MSRIWEAIFNGCVTGTANGLKDHLNHLSQTELKTNREGEKIPIMKEAPDPSLHHQVGVRDGKLCSSPPNRVAKELSLDPHRKEVPSPSQTEIGQEPTSPGEEIPLPTPLSNFLSLPPEHANDRVKYEIKNILRTSRSEAAFKKKPHLKDIVTFAATGTPPKGTSSAERKKYERAAGSVCEKIEHFVKNVFPDVDSKSATEHLIKEASAGEKSADCLKIAAREIMFNIEQKRMPSGDPCPVVNQSIGTAKEPPDVGISSPSKQEVRSSSQRLLSKRAKELVSPGLSNLLSLPPEQAADRVKDEIKDIFMSSRDEAGFKEEPSLQVLIDFASTKKYPKRIPRSDRGKYDLADRSIHEKMGSFFENHFPEKDSKIATYELLNAAREGKKSTDCIKIATSEIMLNVERRRESLSGWLSLKLWNDSDFQTIGSVESVWKTHTSLMAASTNSTGSALGYVVGIGEMVLGGALLCAGGVIELGSFGTLTVGVVPMASLGVTLIGHGFTTTIQNANGASNVFNRNKSRNVKPDLPAIPDDYLKRPGWNETSHPEEKKNGHRTFENKETGEKVRHDEAQPGEPGHKGNDHYHEHNPERTGKHDKYLDCNGKPTGKNSDASHLYPPKSPGE